jgi:hypothetical protein
MSRTLKDRLARLELKHNAPSIAPQPVIIRRDDPPEVKAARVAEYRHLQHRRSAPLLICGKWDAEVQRLLLEIA